ncbi:aldose 1-epimerase family protein [Neolewinella antarctica]|uniref:Galactose mutarotase-like enzyme n=1 Tax=Neolewinella antarctica TaxID=442734 RepID=A0ABX0XDV5_9BACT|nr:aldose 1-epimerase family protein [Neolewinella antarctica]NJC27488.1 galactose mutarotase-like enzyme [Neolewinella antarctica]
MRHALENHRLSISVEEKGAELASLINLKNGAEYMWQADPEVWGSSAPVLFPIIGMLKDGETSINGEKYRIPKHGMVRNNEELELFYHGEDRLTFRMCSTEETLKTYPYEFDFRITYRLRNEHVICYHEVTNTGSEPMFFCLGGHPAFRVPFREGERYEDYFLRFEEAETSKRWEVTKEGTIGPDTHAVPWEDGNILPLTHDLFSDDALVFKDLNSPSVILESRHSGPVLKVDYAGWTHLGIWAKPDGDFVCIEPWMGLADAYDSDKQFVRKEGIVELAAGETFEMSYDIKVLGLEA